MADHSAWLFYLRLSSRFQLTALLGPGNSCCPLIRARGSWMLGPPCCGRSIFRKYPTRVFQPQPHSSLTTRIDEIDQRTWIAIIHYIGVQLWRCHSVVILTQAYTPAYVAMFKLIRRVLTIADPFIWAVRKRSSCRIMASEGLQEVLRLKTFSGALIYTNITNPSSFV